MADAFVEEFPESILLADLLATHAEYNPICPLTGVGILDKHSDLYEGGQSFRKRVEKYLVRRAIESAAGGTKQNQDGYNPKSSGSVLSPDVGKFQNSGNAGSQQYGARLKRAWYTPLVASVVDFMCAAVNQNSPSVVAGVLAQESDPAMKYWREFNTNCDGNGQDVASIWREALLETLLHKRAYLAVRFKGGTYENQAEQEKAGATDGRVCLWSARFVDDWKYDENKKLERLRTHSEEATRSVPWKQPDQTKHCWRYITRQAIYEYEIEYKNTEKPAPESTQVTRKSVTINETGVFPVVPINAKIWVMDRLADTALALFNRQSAANWSLDQMAFALLVIKSGKNIDQITADDIVALHLDQGDAAEFQAPPPAIFAAQQSDIERLKAELFAALHMMALQAMKDKGGNPASGDAKELDMAGMSTLLESFGAPMKDALDAVVKIIQAVRGETFPLAVHGLNKFDVQSAQSKIATAGLFLALQGIPESARKWVVLDASLAATANAPAEVRENVVSEMLNAEPLETITNDQISQDGEGLAGGGASGFGKAPAGASANGVGAAEVR